MSKFRTRTRYYDAIPSTDDGHPVDLAVHHWEAHHERERRRALALQRKLLAVLTPPDQSAFLELEELQSTVAAEREESFFDLGIRYGIERERRRRGALSRAAVLALVEFVAERAISLVEVRADERKSRTRRGAHARST